MVLCETFFEAEIVVGVMTRGHGDENCAKEFEVPENPEIHMRIRTRDKGMACSVKCVF